MGTLEICFVVLTGMFVFVLIMFYIQNDKYKRTYEDFIWRKLTAYKYIVSRLESDSITKEERKSLLRIYNIFTDCEED